MSWFQRIQEYSFNKNNVYIVPSRYGFRYVGINFFLFIIAITYANNLALLISFFMVTYFIIQMFASHRIIFDIAFKKLHFENQFLSEKVYFTVFFEHELELGNAPLIEIEFHTKNRVKLPSARFTKMTGANSFLSEIKGIDRGKFELKRIKLYTNGHSKMFHVWRYYKLEQTIYIYPSKKMTPVTKDDSQSSEISLLQERDFDQHIRYISGMPSKRIDWKVYAKSGELYSKRFIDHLSKSREINYAKLIGNKEDRLQQMSYLIDRSNYEKISYSLVLPNLKISADLGQQHFRKSMEAISEF